MCFPLIFDGFSPLRAYVCSNHAVRQVLVLARGVGERRGDLLTWIDFRSIRSQLVGTLGPSGAY